VNGRKSGLQGYLDGDFNVETCLASLHAICGYVDNYGWCANFNAKWISTSRC
jgi:hypothetical protein